MSPLARLGLLTLLWMTPVAGAVPSKVRLEYTQDEVSRRCSTEEALRESISARLGRNPWDDAAPELLRIQVHRDKVRWRAKVEWLDATGQRKGWRELSSEQEDCQELLQALELAIALVLDPPVFQRPRAAPPPSPIADAAPLPAQDVPLPPSPAPAPSAQVPPAEPPSRAPSFAVGLGTRVSWGLLPKAQAGIQAEGAFRFERFSFSLDATVWPSRTTPVEPAPLRSMLITAGARACVHVGPFGACPQLSAGLLRCEGIGLEEARPAQAPWLAPGARLLVEWRSPLPRLRLQLLAEGQLILTRHRFLAGEVELWRPPQFGGSLGLLGMWDTRP